LLAFRESIGNLKPMRFGHHPAARSGAGCQNYPREEKEMIRKNNPLAVLFASVLLTGYCAVGYAGDSNAGNSLGYEFIGQVLNASATQSLQYGYLSSVPGLNSVSTSGPVSEANAVLSFYNDTATQQVINNGPIRVIDRTGTATIYFNASGGGNFTNPDTFRAGTPIQTCSLRHQVVIDTSSGYFTATFEMTITSVRVFDIGSSRYVLGRPGEVYHWSVYGKLTQQGPPSAQIAGFASGIKATHISGDR
jgi:hypothetical protein